MFPRLMEHMSRNADESALEKAGVQYETLMTAPRTDMGDSIQKAFRNVDDILNDLGVEATEENRRAVRILGITEPKLQRIPLCR